MLSPAANILFGAVKAKKVSYEDWSGEHNHWVKPTHIFYFEINCKIAETIHKLNGLTKRHYNHDKPVTPYSI